MIASKLYTLFMVIFLSINYAYCGQCPPPSQESCMSPTGTNVKYLSVRFENPKKIKLYNIFISAFCYGDVPIPKKQLSDYHELFPSTDLTLFVCKNDNLVNSFKFTLNKDINLRCNIDYKPLCVLLP